jgi:hypothetical protein
MDRLGITTVHKCQKRVQAGIVLDVGLTWLGTIMSLCVGWRFDPIIRSD